VQNEFAKSGRTASCRCRSCSRYDRPNYFPSSTGAGYGKMSTLAKELLIPSLVLLVIALAISKAWGKSRFLNLVIAGVVSGVIATIALEVVRELGFRLGFMPGSLPKLMGVLLTDRFLQGPALFSNVVGWTYHFWNGACFGMIYALLFGRIRWWFAVTVTLAHLAFGTVLGLSLNKWFNIDSSNVFNLFSFKTLH